MHISSTPWMKEKKTIFLGPTKNFQRSLKFLRLSTGHIITRKQLTSLSMPQYVIKKLEDMDIKENYEEEILFDELNGKILKVYDDDASTGE